MLKPRSFAYSVALAGALVFSVPAAQAQSFPTRTITLVVPFSAGTGLDGIARDLAPRLSAKLGRTVVVENRTGAGGAIGSAYVARSDADGHTLLFHTPSIVVDQFIKLQPTVIVQNDLAPVALIAKAAYGLFAAENGKYRTFAEFVKAAKEKPGALRYSSSGNGSSSNMYAELLWKLADIKVTHVPYPGGPEQMLAIAQDQAQVTILPVPVAKGPMDSKTLKPILVATKVASLPNVQSAAEAGLPAYQPVFWNGIFAPKNTPPAILDTLNKEFNALLSEKTFKERNEALGYEIETISREDFNKLVLAEVETAGQAVAAAGIEKR